MLRLASSSPPLWRRDSSVQLGTDAPIRLDDVTPWQEALLDELSTGIPDAMLIPLARSLGASAAETERFVAQIAPALHPGPPGLPPLRLEMPPDTAYADESSLVAGLRAAGASPESTTRWVVDDPDPRHTVVAVSHRLTLPQRAGRLMSADVAHLPIELAGDRVTVGPLVVPGRTACLACRSADRRDRDPEWPQLATQLLGRAAVATDPPLLVEAAAVAVRLLRAGAATPSFSVVLSATSERRRWFSHRPHPACLCRSPAGTARDPAHRPPTTATGFARPA